MDPKTLGAGFAQILLLAIFVLPAIFFILTQQQTLKVVRREYRELSPVLVWLQLIPIFSYFWVFVVVTRIADSLSKEIIVRQEDSILGIPDFDAVGAINRRPTYKIGMAYCFLYVACPVCVILVNLFAAPGSGMIDQVFPFVLGIILLAMMACWIVYWVQLAQNKRKLERFQ